MTFTKPPESASPLFGLVLAGGRSVRMGADKSSIQYHGKPQFEHLYELLGKYCDEVFLSIHAGQVDRFANTRFLTLEDNASVEGPLAGILTAFQYSAQNRPKPVAWLVVVCDLPLLSEQSIRKLVQNRNPDKLATAFWDSDHRFPEPSVCIWEPAAHAAMLRAVDEGAPYPRTILMNHEIDLLDIDDVSELTNANTPEEVTVIQQNLKNRL